MKTLQLLVTVLFAGTLLNPSAMAEQYGAALTLSEPVSVEQAIQAADAGKADVVLIEGEVTSVCQQKGCWMGFSSAAGDIRVTFKDYGFFVPFSIVGETAQVEGSVEKVSHSLKNSKHIVKDAGGDPDTVTEPLVEYQMVATGVEVVSNR